MSRVSCGKVVVMGLYDVFSKGNIFEDVNVSSEQDDAILKVPIFQSFHD